MSFEVSEQFRKNAIEFATLTGAGQETGDLEALLEDEQWLRLRGRLRQGTATKDDGFLRLSQRFGDSGLENDDRQVAARSLLSSHRRPPAGALAQSFDR